MFDLIELRGLNRPHVSVDVSQFDRAAPVVQVEASVYGAPVGDTWLDRVRQPRAGIVSSALAVALDVPLTLLFEDSTDLDLLVRTGARRQ